MGCAGSKEPEEDVYDAVDGVPTRHQKERPTKHFAKPKWKSETPMTLSELKASAPAWLHRTSKRARRSATSSSCTVHVMASCQYHRHACLPASTVSCMRRRCPALPHAAWQSTGIEDEMMQPAPPLPPLPSPQSQTKREEFWDTQPHYGGNKGARGFSPTSPQSSPVQSSAAPVQRQCLRASAAPTSQRAEGGRAHEPAAGVLPPASQPASTQCMQSRRPCTAP